MSKIYDSYFRVKYGKSLKELSSQLKVSEASVSNWHRSGYDIFEKTEILKICGKNKYLRHLWHNLKSRCGYPGDKKYKYYGGRGILLKLEKIDLVRLWKRDKGWLLKNPSIDRIDNDGHYEYENCRFIEKKDNLRIYKKRLS